MSVLLCKSGEAGKFDFTNDPTGLWVSEKLDGIRAYRSDTHNRLLSRNGNAFHTPEYFFKNFPDLPLDGELWLGRKHFDETISIVSSYADKGWNKLKYLVFDIPDPKLGPVEKRWEILAKAVKEANCPNLLFVPQTKCTGREQLIRLLDLVTEQGAEGLMLRKPHSVYEAKRSNTLLKLKKFLDDEATVYGYETIEINTPGKKHLRGAMGALLCRLANGVEFKVGTGFDENQRIKPPKIGSVITFKYQELTKSGVPRFPRYVAVRDYE